MAQSPEQGAPKAAEAQSETTAAEREANLRDAAERALAEAAERRAAAPERDPALTEIGGRDGPDPTRFGDWEKKGVISDF